jgi:hypothetical protein
MAEKKPVAVAADDQADPAPKPIQWAKGLVDALKKSGTGETALNVIRAAMVSRDCDPAHAKLPPRHPDRHLTAKEAVAILERDLPQHLTTIEKARQLAEKGVYLEPAPVKPAADLLDEPPETEAPERELPAAETKVEPRQIAGVVDKTPGVHNVTDQTVGLKKVEKRGKVGVGS